MTKFIEKSLRPKPTSEAERQWIDEQGHFGSRCFAYPGDDMPTNNVFSLDYYRNSIQIIPPFKYDEEKGEYVQDEEKT